MIPPPGADLVARFAGDVARAWPLPRRRGAEDARRLTLAVSGGPDSLALLLLAHAAMPGRCAAVTVDHQLRREAAAEAAEVARVCGMLGVPHETLPVTVAPGNVQAGARAAPGPGREPGLPAPVPQTRILHAQSRPPAHPKAEPALRWNPHPAHAGPDRQSCTAAAASSESAG